MSAAGGHDYPISATDRANTVVKRRQAVRWNQGGVTTTMATSVDKTD